MILDFEVQLIKTIFEFMQGA